MAIKLTSFSEQGLVQFLQSHRETQLSIKVNLQTHHDISYLKIMEDQFSQFNHLTEFSITIPKYCALAQRGYTHVSNSIKCLTQLKKLTIQIDGFIQDEELVILQKSIQSLNHLQTLIFKVSSQNDINSLSGKEFVDSLSSLQNLRKLTLVFKRIKKNQVNEGNIHFWNGIQNLQNLEKLALKLEGQNYGQEDLLELFSYIIVLKQLKHFSFIELGRHLSNKFKDMIISFLGKMKNLKSLEIDFDQNLEFGFSATQRIQILKNLSNLKSLEKLKMKTIQRELTKHHLKEYSDLIGNLKDLKKFSIECDSQDIEEIKSLNYLSQSFLNLANITYFELIFKYIQVYNEFISDLSISLLNMKNLSTLKLYLGNINEYQCLQLNRSFVQLNNLTSLLIEIPTYVFQNLDDGLTNLKELIIRTDECFDNYLFYQYLHKLVNLETLEISNINLFKAEDLILLNITLKNFKKLKELDTSLTIKNLDDQQSVQILESTFKELESLESLKILFRIKNKSEEITKMNILEHLKNLKKISIDFTSKVLNVFDLSSSLLTNQYILEEVKVICLTSQNPKTTLKMIDSLSINFSKIKKLTLRISFNNSTPHSKKFSTICSRFTNLQHLTLEDDQYDSSFSFYTKGIKKLKELKQLEIDHLFSEDDVRKLGKSLLKLENLRKIKLTTPSKKNGFVNVDKELSKVLQYNKKILEIQINLRGFFDSLCQKFTNTVSLKEGVDEKEEYDIQNETIFYEQKVIENVKQYENKRLKLLPNDMKIDIIIKDKGQEHLFFINNLDNIGLQYLMNVEIKINKSDDIFQNEIKLTIQDFIIQFNQLNQLRYLTLDLLQLTFSAEQIAYFSQNIKYLINLRYLYIRTYRIDDQQFCDEMKHLKELEILELKTNISEAAIVSLGRSLMELKNLSVCNLKFEDQSSFGIQGVLSIMNGLKGLLNLEILILNLYSQGNEDSEETEVFVSDFFEKMKKLYQFEFKMRLGQQYTNILQLCSSLNKISELETLTIELFNNIQQTQEMLDQLIIQINQLALLRSVNIAINSFKEDDGKFQFSVSKQFSQYLNRNHDKPLEINGYYQLVQLSQEDSFSLKINSSNITNIKFNILEDLDEKKVIEYNSDNTYIQKILLQIERYSAKKIILKYIVVFDEQQLMDFYTFVSRIRNVSILHLSIIISTDKEDLLGQVINSILMLNNLHTLLLNITTIEEVLYLEQRCNEKYFLQALSILQKHQNLSSLYLIQCGPLKSVKRSIQKKMKKLVQYNFNAKDNINI